MAPDQHENFDPRGIFRDDPRTFEENTMNCDNVWDLLSVYADGETSLEETAMVDTHIAVCCDCARDLAFMRNTSVVLSETPEVEPPATLRASILAATVDRKTLAERVLAGIRGALAPASLRYGAAAGAAGLLAAVALHFGVTDLRSPVEYRPQPQVTARNQATQPELDQLVPPMGIEDEQPAAPAPPVRDAERPATAAGRQATTPLHSRPQQSPAPAHIDGRVMTASVRQGGKSDAAVQTVKPALQIAKAGATSKNGAKKQKPGAGVTRGGQDTRSTSPTTGGMTTEPQPMTTEEMMVASNPAPMKPVSGDMMTANMVEPMNTAAEAGEPAPSKPVRYTLTGGQMVGDASQAASLAELKRQLRGRNLEGIQALEKSLKAREIRVPVFRGNF
jgi:hypothetical protein